MKKTYKRALALPALLLLTSSLSAYDLSEYRAFHLNDSRFGCGERRDRHAHVGEGEIGARGFKRLVRDERFGKVGQLILKFLEQFSVEPVILVCVIAFRQDDVGLTLLLIHLWGAFGAMMNAGGAEPSREWRVAGGDSGSNQHSPLDQINKDNVASWVKGRI